MLSRDEIYMEEALKLARGGAGSVSPNPLVGCVITRGDKIIGRGWHGRYGGPHAEVEAVMDAGCVKGAEVFVNLEPCSHYGKTPPCAEMLIKKGVSRVVVGMRDPNPKVNGAGEAMLRAAGIEVVTGVLEERCKWINRGFIFSVREKRPYVTLKIAAALDGKIALEDGSSKWITGAESRRKVHAMRAASDAVLTGIGTVLADDPRLTVRDAPGRTPLRVILDRDLRMPEDANIMDVSQGPVLIITGRDSDAAKAARLAGLGVEVERLDCAEDCEIDAVLAILYKKGVNYLMVEAGAGVTGAFLNSRRADELALFTAPKVFGCGKCWTDGLKIEKITEALELKSIAAAVSGADLLIGGVFACSPDL